MPRLAPAELVEGNSTMDDYYRWGYFLSYEEILDLYKAWGGQFGTFNPDNLDDVFHARRNIFMYLMPGHISVWLGYTREADGVFFFIGKPNCPIRESVEVDLAQRCFAIFRCPPCPFTLVPNTGGEIYVMKRKGELYKVTLIEFLQSNTVSDRYPPLFADFTPEERRILGWE